MPELVFKGKEYVYNHHLTVPYRPLIPHADKSIGPTDLAGNLIIHGDNLHALKSFLPCYAGKVDLVFIDPPYNTGNENWSYNDNVNSPVMKEWLKSNPVNSEDILRPGRDDPAGRAERAARPRGRLARLRDGIGEHHYRRRGEETAGGSQSA